MSTCRRNMFCILAIGIFIILIVGATENQRDEAIVKPGTIRYAVGIFTVARSFAGTGAIISPQIILTAASKLYHVSGQLLTVYGYNGTNRKSVGRQGKSIKMDYSEGYTFLSLVQGQINHPRFMDNSCMTCGPHKKYDLTILVLDKSLAPSLKNGMLQRLNLPNEQPISGDCTVVTVGRSEKTNFGGLGYEQPTIVVRSSKQSLVETSSCEIEIESMDEPNPHNDEEDQLARLPVMTPFLCARDQNTELHWDASGGLLVQGKYLIGILSNPRYSRGSANVYTNVYDYRQWINSEIVKFYQTL